MFQCIDRVSDSLVFIINMYVFSGVYNDCIQFFLLQGYYYGYDSSVDATVINSFATAAFRMGHPLINMNFIRPDPTYTKPQGPTIRVKDA